MNRVIKSALIVFTVFVFIVISKNTTYALVPLLEIDKFKLDSKVVSCVLISSSIDNKLNGFENSKAKHVQIYTKLVDRLEQMVEKWSDWGYDTEKIEKDLDIINEKIDEYEKDYDGMATKLETLKSLCGSDDFNTKLTEVKNTLKEMRKDVVDIRTFYQVTIRKDILSLKNQVLD